MRGAAGRPRSVPRALAPPTCRCAPPPAAWPWRWGRSGAPHGRLWTYSKGSRRCRSITACSISVLKRTGGWSQKRRRRRCRRAVLHNRAGEWKGERPGSRGGQQYGQPMAATLFDASRALSHAARPSARLNSARMASPTPISLPHQFECKLLAASLSVCLTDFDCMSLTASLFTRARSHTPMRLPHPPVHPCSKPHTHAAPLPHPPEVVVAGVGQHEVAVLAAVGHGVQLQLVGGQLLESHAADARGGACGGQGPSGEGAGSG